MDGFNVSGEPVTSKARSRRQVYAHSCAAPPLTTIDFASSHATGIKVIDLIFLLPLKASKLALSAGLASAGRCHYGTHQQLAKTARRYFDVAGSGGARAKATTLYYEMAEADSSSAGGREGPFERGATRAADPETGPGIGLVYGQ